MSDFYFSEKMQCFFNHMPDSIEDLILVTESDWLNYKERLNNGCYLYFENGTSYISNDEQPDFYHTYDKIKKSWIINDSNLELSLKNKRSNYNALSRRQFKLALLESDLLDKVESAISSIKDSSIKNKIQIEYSEATEFFRLSDSVLTICKLLDLSEVEIDEIWESAIIL